MGGAGGQSGAGIASGVGSDGKYRALFGADAELNFVDDGVEGIWVGEESGPVVLVVGGSQETKSDDVVVRVNGEWVIAFDPDAIEIGDDTDRGGGGRGPIDEVGDLHPDNLIELDFGSGSQRPCVDDDGLGGRLILGSGKGERGE